MLDALLPGRISFETGAFLAAVTAFGLDDLRRAPAAPVRSTPFEGGGGLWRSPA